MMGFDGTSVTEQVRTLIEKYHVGSILLKAQNLKCAAPAFLCYVLASAHRLTID
jgi:beta-N-acetylhexosaminidase